MPQGGRRVGAGRPRKEKSDARPQHQMRAYPQEWELIEPFAKIVKSSCAGYAEAKNFLNNFSYELNSKLEVCKMCLVKENEEIIQDVNDNEESVQKETTAETKENTDVTEKTENKNNDEFDFLFSVDDIPSPKRMLFKSLQNKDVQYCVKKTIKNIEDAVKNGKVYAPIFLGDDQIYVNEMIVLNIFKECGYKEISYPSLDILIDEVESETEDIDFPIKKDPIYITWI